MKDNRKTYRNQQIEVNGNFVTFDGKHDPATNVLKVYKMQGDVNLFEEALQNFCTDKGISKAVIMF